MSSSLLHLPQGQPHHQGRAFGHFVGRLTLDEPSAVVSVDAVYEEQIEVLQVGARQEELVVGCQALLQLEVVLPALGQATEENASVQPARHLGVVLRKPVRHQLSFEVAGLLRIWIQAEISFLIRFKKKCASSFVPYAYGGD